MLFRSVPNTASNMSSFRKLLLRLRDDPFGRRLTLPDTQQSKTLEAGNQHNKSLMQVSMLRDKEPERFCRHQAFPYQGSSMWGTFRAGDILLTEAISLEDVRLGDVLTYCSSQCRKTRDVVVHRVVAHTSGGFVTQGDAMRRPDTDPVRAQNLLGRVIQIQRGGRVYPVKNGWRGRLWAHYLRIRRRFLSLGRAPYHWLRASGIARRLWSPPVASVTLATSEGLMVKYLCGGKTVAFWRPETSTYWCRKPYDLVLDVPGPIANDQRINE